MVDLPVRDATWWAVVNATVHQGTWHVLGDGVGIWRIPIGECSNHTGKSEECIRQCIVQFQQQARQQEDVGVCTELQLCTELHTKVNTTTGECEPINYEFVESSKSREQTSDANNGHVEPLGGDVSDCDTDSSSDDTPDVLEYVRKHPFPSYEAMENEIAIYVRHRGGPYFVLGDYGPETHDECARMYSSGFLNREIDIAVGKAIARQGGVTAMQAAFYVMSNCTPLSHAAVPDVRYASRLIQWHWDGIVAPDGNVWGT